MTSMLSKTIQRKCEGAARVDAIQTKHLVSRIAPAGSSYMPFLHLHAITLLRVA